jgi:ElaB/YqjD/DUF883 family membrane-anchored ribosome-binding protein
VTLVIEFLGPNKRSTIISQNRNKVMVTRRKTNSEPIVSSQEKLVASVKQTLDDAEALLREAANATGDSAQALREEALNSLKRSRETLNNVEEDVLARGRQAVQATDEYVHQNPWQAITIAGVAGLLVGMLITRR